MAKVTGPFMSLTASGTLANTITASIWKGVAYMRTRVIPKNPKSPLQKAVRSILGTLAKASRAVLTTKKAKLTSPSVDGSQFFLAAVVAAPSGQSWLSFMQQIMNGTFVDDIALYSALTSTKTYWGVGAAAAGLAAYTDVNSDTHDAGEQLYLLAKFATRTLGYSGWDTTQDAAVQVEVNSFVEYVTNYSE